MKKADEAKQAAEDVKKEAEEMKKAEEAEQAEENVKKTNNCTEAEQVLLLKKMLEEEKMKTQALQMMIQRQKDEEEESLEQELEELRKGATGRKREMVERLLLSRVKDQEPTPEAGKTEKAKPVAESKEDDDQSSEEDMSVQSEAERGKSEEKERRTSFKGNFQGTKYHRILQVVMGLQPMCAHTT